MGASNESSVVVSSIFPGKYELLDIPSASRSLLLRVPATEALVFSGTGTLDSVTIYVLVPGIRSNVYAMVPLGRRMRCLGELGLLLLSSSDSACTGVLGTTASGEGGVSGSITENSSAEVIVFASDSYSKFCRNSSESGGKTSANFNKF